MVDRLTSQSKFRSYLKWGRVYLYRSGISLDTHNSKCYHNQGASSIEVLKMKIVVDHLQHFYFFEKMNHLDVWNY